MKTAKDKMHIDKGEEDLDRTHSVGNPKISKDGKSRSIIIKFAVRIKYTVRNIMYKHKKKLKGKNFQHLLVY